MLRGTKKDKRIIYSSTLILLSFLILNTGFCQSSTEFWFAAPEITNQTVSPSPVILHDLDRPIKLVCTAFESAAAVTVTQPANPSFTPIVQNVPSHQMVQIDLTPFIDIVENKPANSILNWGLKISSTSPVNISYEVQCLENSDAFSLKGNNALGKEFIIPAQDIYSNYSNCDLPARNSFVVISTEDSTTVKVIPSKPIVGHNAQDTVTLLMNKGQTWCARAVTEDYFNHLGGSFVLSDKPVAVTIADDAIYPNCSMNVSLNLAGDQLIPREVASTRYIPTFEPNPLDSLNKVWAYVYSFENSTQVFLGGVSKGFINRGEFMKFRIDTVYDTIGAVYIETNKPVIVYVFNVSSYNLSMCGQPGGEIVPPLNCVGSREVTVYFTGPSQNNSFWHNLFITTQISNMGNIIAAYPLPWGPYTIPISDYDTVPGTNNEWVFVRWGNMGVVFNQPLTISCTTGKFQLNEQNFEFTHYNRIAYWSEFSAVNLGPDKQICPGDSVLLDGGYGQQSYLWNTGDTTRKIWVNSAGSYWVTVVSDSCQVTDTINISYFSFTPVNLGPDKMICTGDSVLLNAGTGRSWYLWSTGDTTQTIWAKNAGIYWVKAPDVHCIVSDTVLVSTTPTPVVTNNPMSDSICSGIMTSISLSSSIPGAMFHWTATLTSGSVSGFLADSGLVIQQTLVNTASTPGIVTYHITPKVGSCMGNTVDYQVTVNLGDSVKISITSSSNYICAGTSVNFTATPTNPGSTPVYQWKINSVNTGSNSPNFSFTPNNGDVVQCVLTSSNTVCTSNNPATSNEIIMTIYPNLPVSLAISTLENPICEGNPAIFFATPTNKGLLPYYEWFVNGIQVGTNDSTYSYTPSDGDQVTCTLTSNAECVTNNPATSNAITMSVGESPDVSFTICFDTITTLNANPFKLKGGIPLGGTYSGPGVDQITGYFNPAMAGVGIKTISYSYTNQYNCSDNAARIISVIDPAPFSCGDSLTDIRDNKKYPTIQIGSQCWLAVNLNHGQQIGGSSAQRDNCLVEKYCYNDLPANCMQYGALYQWDELMRYEDAEEIQGLCPPGWHVPSEADWNQLFAVYQGNAFAGSPLLYTGYSGFNVLLSGVEFFNQSHRFADFASIMWSSSSHGPYKAWSHGLNEYNYSVSYYPSYRANAFSVRCVRE